MKTKLTCYDLTAHLSKLPARTQRRQNLRERNLLLACRIKVREYEAALVCVRELGLGMSVQLEATSTLLPELAILLDEYTVLLTEQMRLANALRRANLVRQPAPNATLPHLVNLYTLLCKNLMFI